MNEIRKPLKRSLLLGIALLVLAMCICLIGAQYFAIHRTLYRQYESRISGILNIAQSGIDADDLSACIHSGKESEQFHQTQGILDSIKEQTGVHYLYIIVPLNSAPTDNIMNVMAAITRDEYENDPDAIVTLNELTGDAYSADTARKYYDAYQADGDTFFENSTVFGTDYTGMRILRDSAGERVAALCADFDVKEIRSQLRENILDILVIIIIIGLLFASIFIVWADSNVIRPVRQLEKCVKEVADRSHDQRDPDTMKMNMPVIRTGNEVESLAHAVEKMFADMKDYVKDLLKKEKELAKLSTMANRDPLTRVGNMNAFESFAEGLQLKMTEEPQEYAILVMDTDGLKKINEQFGHDKGDLYLLKSCRIICEIFRHSPVFRLGGDEFAAVMKGEDYRNRTELVKQVRLEFEQAWKNISSAPWERVSASIGMTDYDRKTDKTVREVLERAKQMMQEEKKRKQNNS